MAKLGYGVLHAAAGWMVTETVFSPNQDRACVFPSRSDARTAANIVFGEEVLKTGRAAVCEINTHERSNDGIPDPDTEETRE